MNELTQRLKSIPELTEIFNRYEIQQAEEITLGWSNDEKYCLSTCNGQFYLLRLMPAQAYDKKLISFENMRYLHTQGCLVPKPLEIGYCDHNKFIYLMLSWLPGQVLEGLLPTLPVVQQFQLGIQAGSILRQIHAIAASQDCMRWEERIKHFLEMVKRRKANYLACGLHLPDEAVFLRYIDEHLYLLRDREQTWLHGDYHIGNFVLNNEGQLGVIDFNRAGFGDPWMDFRRIIWALKAKCPDFVKGQIKGYFSEQTVPENFYSIVALYVALDAMNSLPWAIPYGEHEVQKMMANARLVLQLFNYFSSDTLLI